ncbi:hypothetical protein ACFVW8_25780 [Streptomyces sp. NPDC058221]|uniref:hypothetical protein n=1 Tax=Streptomyces sp. NPDC058221 TaxID=3346388 RepID=UPI0036DFF4D9
MTGAVSGGGTAEGPGPGTPVTGSSRDGPRRSSEGGSSDSGSRYAAARRSPQCRQPDGQWNGPAAMTATTCPAVTSSPFVTSGRTGS